MKITSHKEKTKNMNKLVKSIKTEAPLPYLRQRIDTSFS